MSRWYIVSNEIVGETRREERKGERCDAVVGEERGLSVSIIRSVSVADVSWKIFGGRCEYGTYFAVP